MPVAASFLLFAYNHEGFIEEAVRGALDQDYEGLEVIVTDDASTDGTADVIERVIAAYDGPKRVRFHRHARNQGLLKSINEAVAASTGDIIILAGGDDVSYPYRTSRLAAALAPDDVVFAWSNTNVVDENGTFERLHYRGPPWHKTLRSFENPNQAALGAANALKRTLFTRFGPLDTGARVEDRTILMRATILGKVVYVDEPLLDYRRHGGNVWLGRAERARQKFSTWRAHVADDAVGRATIYECMLLDLDRALAMPDVDHAEVRRARKFAAEHLRQARQSIVMYGTNSPITKGVAIARIALSGSPGTTWRWLKENAVQRLRFHVLRARAAKEGMVAR